MSPLVAPGAAALVGAALVAAEWGARRALRHSPYRLHPRGWHRRIHPDPDSHPLLEPSIDIRINADGERGRPLPRRWDRTARVLVTGGSAVECFLNDQGTSWPAVMEGELRASPVRGALGVDDVYVGALARSGVCTGTLLGLLRTVLPQYPRLDAVVIMVGASDVFRWLERGADALTPPSPLDFPGVFAEHPRDRFGVRPRQLALREVVRRLDARRPDTQVRAASWMGRARAMRQSARFVHDDAPDATRMLGAATANLREALALVRAAVPHVLVVRQPWMAKEHLSPEEDALLWNGSVGSPFDGEVDTFFSHRVVSQLLSAMDARVAAVCEEEGVPHLNARPSLELSGVPAFFDHCHLTPAGCRVMGASVARRLEAVVADGAAGGTTTLRGAPPDPDPERRAGA